MRGLIAEHYTSVALPRYSLQAYTVSLTGHQDIAACVAIPRLVLLVIQMLHYQMSVPLWSPVMLLCVKQFVGVYTLQLLRYKCDQVTACLMTNSAIWVTIMLCQVTSAARTDNLRSHSCSSRHKLFRWPTHGNPKIIGFCLLGDKAAGAHPHVTCRKLLPP